VCCRPLNGDQAAGLHDVPGESSVCGIELVVRAAVQRSLCRVRWAAGWRHNAPTATPNQAQHTTAPPSCPWCAC
jgi:hypothetical protein